MTFSLSSPTDVGAHGIPTLNPEDGHALVVVHSDTPRNAAPLEPGALA